MSRPDLIEDDLRAAAPRPSEDFARRLDADVAAGFRARGAPRRRWGWRPSGPLLATAMTCVLLALVGGVAVTQLRGGDDLSGGASTTASEMAAPPAGDAASTVAPAPEPPLAGAGAASGTTGAGGAPGVADRRVERSANLDVSVSPAAFDDAAAEVVDVAGRSRSIVATSEITREGDRGRADFTLRVPVARLSATLADLSGLGRLESREESGFDVTGAFVSARDRAGDLRAERASVRRRLAAETDAEEANALRDRLAALQRELGAARAEVARLRQRTSYATVSLTLRTGEEAAADEGAGFTPGDALDDAGGVLGAIAGVAILVLAIAGPIVAVPLALVATVRALRRRRRERALAS